MMCTLLRIHKFSSSGEAYDASQCDDDIRDGDVLSVPSEGVVGVLIEAWPVAVSPVSGKFHEALDGMDWAAITLVRTGEVKDYSESRRLAVEELARL